MTSNDKQLADVGKSLVAAPLHEQVKSRIIERIRTGIWSEGDVLPAELDLAKLLGVSYGTIRRAMGDLTHEGIVMRRRRTGTVVTGRMPNHTLSRFYQYFRLHTASGKLTTTEQTVVSVDVRAATAVERKRLKLTVRAKVSHMVRVRRSGKKPVMVDNVIIPKAQFPDFPDTPEQVPELIFDWLLNQHSVQLGAVNEKVTARLATPIELELLETSTDECLALLDIDAIAIDTLNEPLLIMQHAALTSAHCYVNEMR